MLENNGVDPACPWLNVSGWFNPQNPNPDDHVHGTSGCVASRKPDRLGAAPDVELYSANAASYGDADVTAAADWIVTTNVDVTNMSFGGGYAGAEQFLDRYFDYQVRTYSDSYVASAGNDGLGTPVHSPGTARNVLTVGSFDNNDDGDWVGDAMSAFSSSADPANGCSKPNVAAVGNTVDTLGDSVVGPMAGGCGGLNQPAAWLIDNYCGTSFSSPLRGRQSRRYHGRRARPSSSTPRRRSALMMATAWHNIEGSLRPLGAGRCRGHPRSRRLPGCRGRPHQDRELLPQQLHQQRLLHLQHSSPGRRPHPGLPLLERQRRCRLCDNDAGCGSRPRHLRRPGPDLGHLLRVVRFDLQQQLRDRRVHPSRPPGGTRCG